MSWIQLASPINIFDTIQELGQLVDLLGVLIIVVGLFISTIIYIKQWYTRQTNPDSYTSYRRNLGKVILLGLEFLVAGDIIRSVAGTPTFVSVGILAIIVLIRSFISVTFQMEVDGRWPWQRRG